VNDRVVTPTLPLEGRELVPSTTGGTSRSRYIGEDARYDRRTTESEMGALREFQIHLVMVLEGELQHRSVDNCATT